MSMTGKELEESDSTRSDFQHPPDLQLKRSKNHTILSPQPSDDPKDPLVSYSIPMLLPLGY